MKIICKKLLTIPAFLGVLALTGCGSGKQETTPVDTKVEKTEQMPSKGAKEFSKKPVEATDKVSFKKQAQRSTFCGICRKGGSCKEAECLQGNRCEGLVDYAGT